MSAPGVAPGIVATARPLLPICFLALPWVAAAGASETVMAPRPDIRAGDQWQFAVYYTEPTRVPSRTWIVKSVTRDAIEATENGQALRLTPELNVLDSPRYTETNPRQLSFPLQVGKRWRYDSNWTFKQKGSSGTIAVDVEVLGYERVAVPAGEFHAFKLFARGKLGGSSPTNTFYGGETTTTYWYAPSARAIVRSLHHNPYLGRTVVELVAYQRRP